MNPVTALNSVDDYRVYIPAELLRELPTEDPVDVPDGPLPGILVRPIRVSNYEDEHEYLWPGTEVWVLAFVGGGAYVQKPDSLMFACVPGYFVKEP